MVNTIEIISKILPVIFLIIMGNVFQRSEFFIQNTVNELKKLVINIALPATLFLAFVETNFEVRYILIFLTVFLTCVLMLLIGKVFKAIFNFDNDYIPSIFSGFETGMMGYSIFVAIYGAANMYKLAIVDLGQVTFVFFVLVSYLQKLNGKAANLRQLCVSFIKSPIILSIIMGIVAGGTGVIEVVKDFSLSNSILETLKLLSNLTVPVICIVIGYELHIDLKNIKKPLLIALVRLTILMGIAVLINTFLIGKILNLDNTFKIALYTMFLLPPPFVIPIFIDDRQQKNKQFILNTISIHIILSLAAFIILNLLMK